MGPKRAARDLARALLCWHACDCDGERCAATAPTNETEARRIATNGPRPPLALV